MPLHAVDLDNATVHHACAHCGTTVVELPHSAVLVEAHTPHPAIICAACGSVERFNAHLPPDEAARCLGLVDALQRQALTLGAEGEDAAAQAQAALAQAQALREAVDTFDMETASAKDYRAVIETFGLWRDRATAYASLAARCHAEATRLAQEASAYQFRASQVRHVRALCQALGIVQAQ